MHFGVENFETFVPFSMDLILSPLELACQSVTEGIKDEYPHWLSNLFKSSKPSFSYFIGSLLVLYLIEFFEILSVQLVIDLGNKSSLYLI